MEHQQKHFIMISSTTGHKKPSMNLAPDKMQVLQDLAEQLSDNLAVSCVLCFGSYAIGMQDEKSDLDLLVIVNSIPNTQQRSTIYSKVQDLKIVELAKDLSHWQPAWLPINDVVAADTLKIEIGFNTNAWVNAVIDKLMVKHAISFTEFAFRPYSFFGLLESCYCVYEKNAYYFQLKTKIRPFPLALKKQIVSEHWPMLADCHQDLLDAVERKVGILACQFYIFMALDAAVELLWVINDVYSPASKRTEIFLQQLQHLPPNFMEFIQNSLPKCYEQPQQFIQQLEIVKKYIEQYLRDLKLLS